MSALSLPAAVTSCVLRCMQLSIRPVAQPAVHRVRTVLSLRCKGKQALFSTGGTPMTLLELGTIRRLFASANESLDLAKASHNLASLAACPADCC